MNNVSPNSTVKSSGLLSGETYSSNSNAGSGSASSSSLLSSSKTKQHLHISLDESRPAQSEISNLSITSPSKSKTGIKREKFKQDRNSNRYLRDRSITNPQIQQEKKQKKSDFLEQSVSMIGLDQSHVGSVKIELRKNKKTGYTPTLELSEIPEAKIEETPLAIMRKTEEFPTFLKAANKEIMLSVINSNNLIGYKNKFRSIKYDSKIYIYPVKGNKHSSKVKVNIFQYVVEEYCAAVRKEAVRKEDIVEKENLCGFYDFTIKNLILNNYLTHDGVNLSISPLLGKYYSQSSKEPECFNLSPLQHLLNLPQYDERTIKLIDWLIKDPRITLDVDIKHFLGMLAYYNASESNKSAIPFLTRNIDEDVSRLERVDGFPKTLTDRYQQQIGFLLALLEHHSYVPTYECEHIKSVIGVLNVKTCRKYEEFKNPEFKTAIENFEKLKLIVQNKLARLSDKQKEAYSYIYLNELHRIEESILELKIQPLLDRLSSVQEAKEYQLIVDKILENLNQASFGLGWKYWSKLEEIIGSFEGKSREGSRTLKALKTLVEAAQNEVREKAVAEEKIAKQTAALEAAKALIAKNNKKKEKSKKS